MIVYAEVECHIYDAQSLKEKRSVLKRVIHKVRHEFNVSIAEVDYQSLWQRTKLAIVTVSNEGAHGEQVIQNVLKCIDQFTELERTITSVERI
ncbi:MAG TPA: DUF503 domain-containing protein [Pseudogracilibacillus sp.]|nr:DUF503 domain-containing protein [Pseudogracilibacillus sp.]